MTNARELANLVGGTLTNVTSGTNNVALGDEALEALTEGASNVGIGKDAGTSVTTADENTLIENLDQKNMRRFLVSVAKDVRVMIIKFRYLSGASIDAGGI